MTVKFLRSVDGYILGSQVSTLSTRQEDLYIAAGHATRTLDSQLGPVAPSTAPAVQTPGNVVRYENGSLVSGDGSPVGGPVPALWADRAALATAGVTSAFFTNVGIGGSVWQYNAGRWRPLTGRVVLKNTITDVTNKGAAEVVLGYATLLPGLWQDGDLLEVGFRKSRTGGTSDTDASLIKLGTVAATPGTITGLGSAAALATTTVELTMKSLRLRRLTNTSFRPCNIPGAVGIGGGTSAIADVVGFANLDNATAYLQICSDLTTAGGEVSVLREFTVELIAGA